MKVRTLVLPIAFSMHRHGECFSIHTAKEIPLKKESNMYDDMNLLILGMGRVGSEVAMQAASPDNKDLVKQTIGTQRALTPEKTVDVGSTIQSIQFEEIHIRSVAPRCRYLFVTIPPPTTNDPSYDQDVTLDSIFKGTVELLIPGSWIGLISTTGVYGNHDGAWVTEESECRCTNDDSTARKFVEYESKWIQWAKSCGHEINVFRCSGIYSNDQSALHTVYRNGLDKPIVSETSKSKDESKTTTFTENVTNRIHVHDIGRAVIASMRKHQCSNEKSVSNGNDAEAKSHHRIFNLADNLPETRTAVQIYAAHLLESIGVPVSKDSKSSSKEYVSSHDGSLNIKRKRDSRRQTNKKLVSNQRMLKELLPLGLTYPTYKEGLISIFNDRNNPWWS